MMTKVPWYVDTQVAVKVNLRKVSFWYIRTMKYASFGSTFGTCSWLIRPFSLKVPSPGARQWEHAALRPIPVFKAIVTGILQSRWSFIPYQRRPRKAGAIRHCMDLLVGMAVHKLLLVAITLIKPMPTALFTASHQLYLNAWRLSCFRADDSSDK